MSTKPLPHHIEEISLNAWPAMHTVLYDGWVLRVANGYTKRANSVTALYPGTLDLTAKIDYCERFYRRQKLPPIFRLTDFAQPPDLDKALAARGYQRIDATRVLYLDLSWSGAMASSRAYMLPDRSGLASWLGSFHHMNKHRADESTHRRLLDLVIGEKCPMVLMVEDGVVACGLGILTGDVYGIFDVVTDREHRRQGYALELMEALLDWGINARANHAYLQVMVDNEPAQRLYARLGFQELYRYWYRILV